MDFILRLFNEFSAYSKSNPLVAGAVSLWGLGVATFMFRKVPTTVVRFIWSQLTTSLSFNNEDLGSNLITYSNFMKWINDHQIRRISRTIALTASTSISVVGPGPGTHFFFYKKHLFWARRTTTQGSGGSTKQVIFNVEVRMLGRNRTYVEQFIEEFRFRDDNSEPTVYTINYNDHFTYASMLRKRNIDTVIIPRAVRGAIMKQIEEFRASEDWYNYHGIPYKLAMVLEGLPGTGKTSFVRALAAHYGMHLCIVMPNQIQDRYFFRQLQNAPENSIILIEDFDSAGALARRSGMEDGDNNVTATYVNRNGTMVQESISDSPLQALNDLMGTGATLSGILNAIDGAIPLHNKIIIMTTNVIKNIDPAMLRPGRVDHIHEIGPLGREEIEEYIAMAYPGERLNLPRQVEPITGAQLQSLYMKYRRDPIGFMKELVGFDSIHYRGEIRDVGRDFVDQWRGSSERDHHAVG